MVVGFIGLGKMGKGMTQRLQAAGHEVVAYDQDAAARGGVSHGVRAVASLPELVRALHEPRIVWMMVPAGEPVEQTLFASEGLSSLLGTGDIIVDGGNSYYEDTRRRAAELAKKDITLVDAGVSGGVRGAEHGYALMVGGEKAAVDRIQSLLRALAADGGVGHVGPSGAGHYVKMVHNGIEYGMMESLAEGVDLLLHGPYADLNAAHIAGIWSHGSIIQSYLLALLEEILAAEHLDQVVGKVGETGEGRWSVETAKKYGIPVPAMKAALAVRMRTKRRELFAAKILALLRNRFGGHAVERKP